MNPNLISFSVSAALNTWASHPSAHTLIANEKRELQRIANMGNNALSDLSTNEAHYIYYMFFHRIKTREDILWFQDRVGDMPAVFDAKEIPLEHSFADGMYTRKMSVKQGTVLVGKIHKKDYFVNVLKGRLWLVNEFGSRDIIAPCSFTARAGVKNIGYFLEDTVWLDVHSVASTNIKDAEQEMFASSYQELDEYNNILNCEFNDDSHELSDGSLLCLADT